MRIELHGARCPLHVHEDHRYTVGSCYLAHPRIESQRTDVVEHRRSSSQCCGSNFGFRRVNRDGDRPVVPANPLDDGNDTPELLLHWNRLGSRTATLASDIENISPLLDELQGMLDCCRRIGVESAVGEGIRRHIDDAHNPGEGHGTRSIVAVL
ncbi:hypothetical protein HRbin21_01603 [bacterium HR21]|nr:hypothetical protein HRbin21_01603 [bacterium HR21]